MQSDFELGDAGAVSLGLESERRDGLSVANFDRRVDLDAAFGRGSNAALLADVVAAVDVKVELSGGIRDDASLARALGTGCTRVNLGTAALENPEWTARVIAEHVQTDRDAAAVVLGVGAAGTRHGDENRAQ